ncbi:stress responsive A/B barrel domain protein [Beauveria brongniartii RCEF 3172]|uniref:Stress responsive A/B barrel domain protein n=1 Tax=Beauveria brongniartii RCEF 3172 TaxID=1081107 RepID=A0A162JKG6_9HYPO|nr:stress responsive A/B barrel domain protein [Beauveria brongniartii RCEF 3172]
MADHVHRVTMFKLPKPEDVDAMIEQYKILEATQSKDGRPYLQSVVIGKPEADPRAQGFTLVAKTEFASVDDMKYYDEECPAHKKLKGVAKSLTMEGVVSVFFKPTITSGISQ